MWLTCDSGLPRSHPNLCLCVCGDLQEKADLGELNFSLCYLPTAGRLTATIIKATNLKAMDLTGFSGNGGTHQTPPANTFRGKMGQEAALALSNCCFILSWHETGHTNPFTDILFTLTWIQLQHFLKNKLTLVPFRNWNEKPWHDNPLQKQPLFSLLANNTRGFA